MSCAFTEGKLLRLLSYTMIVTLSAGLGDVQADSPRAVRLTGFAAYRDQAGPGCFGIDRTTVVWQGLGPISEVKRQAVTDKLGRYELELPEGAYRVQVDPPNGYQSTTEQVDVRVGMEPKYFLLAKRSERDLPPSPAPVNDPGLVTPPPSDTTLNVHVVQHTLLSRLTPPVSDATIDIFSQGKPVASGRTDLGGRASLRLAPGQYEIRVQAPGYGEHLDTVSLEPGTIAQKVHLVRSVTSLAMEQKKSTLTLRIARIDDRIMKKGQPPKSKPLPGARVILIHRGRRVATGLADASGRFVANVSPGTYQVDIAFDGFRAVRQQLILGPGQINRQVVLSPSSARPPVALRQPAGSQTSTGPDPRSFLKPPVSPRRPVR